MPNPEPSDAFRRILQTLNDLDREIVSRDDPETLLPEIAGAATQLLPLAVGSLWRRETSPSVDRLRLAAVGDAKGRRLFPQTLNLPGSLSRQALASRTGQTILDLAAAPPCAERDLAAQGGLVSLLCMPIVAHEPTAAGILMGFTAERHAFSDLDIQVAEALARQAGMVWHLAALKGATRRAKAELHTRKRVDRAKEILMDERGMNAEEAYRWIQKRSMDTRRSMRDVAETIILSSETGHYTSIPHALDLLDKLPRK